MSGDETVVIARSMWFEKRLAYSRNALKPDQPNDAVPNRSFQNNQPTKTIASALRSPERGEFLINKHGRR
jgi:hypothetical protein